MAPPALSQAKLGDEILDYRDLAALPKSKAIYNIDRPDMISYSPYVSHSVGDRQSYSEVRGPRSGSPWRPQPPLPPQTACASSLESPQSALAPNRPVILDGEALLEWGAGSRKLEDDQESARGKASVSSLSSVGLMLMPGEWTGFPYPARSWPRSLLTRFPVP